MEKTCSLTGQPFTISEFEQEYCRKNDVPLPALGPFERLRELAAFRSRISIMYRNCNMSGKRILSCFPATAPHNIVDIGVWESDSWDGLDYGRDYDFTRPFFAQMAELFVKVPLPNLAVNSSTLDNSPFTNGITGAKNCYLLFGASYNEDCAYSILTNYSKNIYDSALVWHSELCYDCVNIQRCYNVVHSVHCTDCSNSAFLYNCLSCKNCFGSANLVRREYCLYNEQLTKDEYTRRMQDLDLGSFAVYEQQKEGFEKWRTDIPIKHFFGVKHENCSGNFISNSRNCSNCYFCDKSEDLDWCIWLNEGRSSAFHMAYSNSSELIYNSVTVGDQSYDVRFSVECWPGAQNIEYCLYTGRGSNNCFGCVGLRKQSYCILNKQYSKKDYHELKKRIIAHMRSTGEYGRFFSSSMAPFPYNASEAQHFLPLPRQEAEQRGYYWKEDEPVEPAAPTYQAADHIRDVPDDVVAKELVCSATQKRYRIAKTELEFLRRNNLPLPRLAPMERIRRLTWIQRIEPIRIAPCEECGKGTETAFSAATPILCTPCFEKVVL